MRKFDLKLAAAGAMGLAAMLLGPVGALAGVSYDLTIAKSHTGNFTAGQNGTFTVTVSQLSGSGTGSDTVTVTDTLPTGLTYVSSTPGPDRWACGVSGQTVTCTATPDLSGTGSSSFTITVAVAPNAPSSVVNTATVAAPGDQTPNNNTARDTVTINPGPSPSPSPSATVSPSPAQSAAPAATAPVLPRAGGPAQPAGVPYLAIFALVGLLVGGVAATMRQLRQ